MVSRVGFLRRVFIMAVLKDAGTMPEVREELIIDVRNGRMLLETSWGRLHQLGVSLVVTTPGRNLAF